MHRPHAADGPSRADRRISAPLNPVMKLSLVQRMQESMKQVTAKMSSDSHVLSPTKEKDSDMDNEEDDEDVMDAMLANQCRRHTNMQVPFARDGVCVMCCMNGSEEVGDPAALGSVLPSEKNFQPGDRPYARHITAPQNVIRIVFEPCARVHSSRRSRPGATGRHARCLS